MLQYAWYLPNKNTHSAATAGTDEDGEEGSSFSSSDADSEALDTPTRNCSHAHDHAAKLGSGYRFLECDADGYFRVNYHQLRGNGYYACVDCNETSHEMEMIDLQGETATESGVCYRDYTRT